MMSLTLKVIVFFLFLRSVGHVVVLLLVRVIQYLSCHNTGRHRRKVLATEGFLV